MKRLPKLRVTIYDKCQLSCSFCGGNSEKMENFQPEDINTLIGYGTFLKVVEAYILSGGKYIQFTGGEPLLRKNIVTIVNDVYLMGGIPEINTNGLLLTKELSKELKEAGLSLIKISVPAFNFYDYLKVTGSNKFFILKEKIKIAGDYLNIRINTVATMRSLDELDDIISFCKETGVNEVLFLEMLYYHTNEINRGYFKKEYCSISKYFIPKVESKYTIKFEKVDFFSEFYNCIYTAKISENLSIYTKQSEFVPRINECFSCSNMCQEGIYELRLSSGGYLNFCNCTNRFGKRLSEEQTLDDIQKIFSNYLLLFDEMKKTSNEIFFNKYNLEIY